RVLVLPVVPVALRLHWVYALRRESLLNIPQRNHAPLPVILYRDDRVRSRLNEHIAVRAVLIKRTTDVAFGQQIEWQPFGDEVLLSDLPFAFRYCILINFRIAALVDSVVRHVD